MRSGRDRASGCGGAALDVLMRALIDIDTRRSLASTEQSNHVQPDSRDRETQARANDKLSSLVGDQSACPASHMPPPLPSVIVPPTSKQHLPHCHQGRDFVSPREDGRLAERPGRATVASSLSPSSGMVPAAVGRKQCRQIEAPPAYAGRRAVRSTGTFGPRHPGDLGAQAAKV